MPSKSVLELAKIGAEAMADDRIKNLSLRAKDRAAFVAHTESLLIEKFDAHMSAKMVIKPHAKP